VTDLIGTEWTLREYVRDGVTYPPPRSRIEVVVRFSDSAGFSGTDGCNYLRGQVRVSGSRLVFGRTMITAVLCRGLAELTDAVGAVLRAAVSWELQGETLRLTADDGTALVYAHRASIFPSDWRGTPSGIIAGGRRGRGDFRFYYNIRDNATVALAMESRDAPGDEWGRWTTTMKPGSAGPQPDPMSSATSTVDGDRVVAGLVNADVARVVFHSLAADTDSELPLRTLAGTSIQAFADFVGDPPRGSYVIAYDAAGSPLGPPYEPYWWLPGDPV
jgi:heat shock protein HslJ